MNASELRINNYLEFRHPIMGWSAPTKCEDWMIKDVGLIPDSYRAVPLTEEWLNKFGFNEMITRKGYFIKPLTIDNKMTLTSEDFIFHLKSGYVYVDFGDIVSQIGIPIIYVHEFQNIYFALTGEELI